MKIEITVEGTEPITHPLTKPKMVLGSGADCDIVVAASGVSRHHLTVSVVDDQYFVTDMGSTNGTFINDDRLVPGQKAEFTSFFPVKLGGLVTLALLSDDEVTESSFEFAKAVPRSESTQPGMTHASGKTSTSTKITPPPSGQAAALREHRTSTSIKRPAKTPAKKPPGKDQDAALMQRTKMLALGIAVLGSAAFFYFQEDEVVPTEGPQEVTQVVAPVVTPLNALTFTPPLPPAASTLGSAYSDQKCGQELEARWCKAMQMPEEDRTVGVVFTFANVVLTLPQLDSTQTWELFSKDFTMSESAKGGWPAELDPRDLATFYLARLTTEDWAELPEDYKWLFVSSGKPNDTIYVANLAALKKAFAAGTWESLRQPIATIGPDAMNILSGFFRDASSD